MSDDDTVVPFKQPAPAPLKLDPADPNTKIILRLMRIVRGQDAVIRVLEERLGIPPHESSRIDPAVLDAVAPAEDHENG